MNRLHTKDINSLKDLYAEMDAVKMRIKEQEADLGKRWKQLPGELVNSLLSSIFPLILGNQLGASVWKVLKSVFGLIKGKSSSGAEQAGWKDGFAGGATQLGILAGLKLLSGLWKKKTKHPSEA
jgi:hypothetical protein